MYEFFGNLVRWFHIILVIIHDVVLKEDGRYSSVVVVRAEVIRQDCISVAKKKTFVIQKGIH